MGKFVCVTGVSGSGKSSLLNQLAGMEKPTSGEVRIGGVPISRLSEDQLATFRQKHLGFVFQSYNLLPNLTATENVAMPLMFRGVPKEKREEAARKMLREVDRARETYRLCYCDRVKSVLDHRDLLMDSSRFGPEVTAKLLCGVVRQVFGEGS